MTSSTRNSYPPGIWGWSLLSCLRVFICVLLFYAERGPRGYLGFGVNLVINLLSPAHLRAFLFYLEPASPGYLDCGVYVIIQFFSFVLRVFLLSPSLRNSYLPGIRVYLVIYSLSPAHLRTPLLHGTRIPRLFGFWIFLIINSLFFCSSACLPFLRRTHIPDYFGFRGYLFINFLFPTRPRGFLFYLELASPGYLGFGGYLIINLLC